MKPKEPCSLSEHPGSLDDLVDVGTLCCAVWAQTESVPLFDPSLRADQLTWLCFQSQMYPKEDAAEYEDRKVFVDLLKQLLDLDGDQRISPSEALQHPFITMSHLIKQPDGRE